MVSVRKPSRFSSIAESAAWGTYALPHITIGVAMIGFALTLARPLYQTLILLVGTYVIMFLAQAMASAQDSIKPAPDLEDASRGLGHGQLSTLFRVTIPMVSPGLLAGAALGVHRRHQGVARDALLRPNGFETLAVRIWSATSEGFLTRASMAGLALIAVSIVPLFLVTSRDLRD